MELTPDFSIIINGSNTFPKDRVLSISTNDQAGIVSDSCEIELDDFDGALQLPNTEAKFVVSLGYKETGLTQIGTYFVKEITIDGAQKKVKISGNAAPKSMRTQNSKTNIGGLKNYVNAMSDNFDLEAAFDDDLEEIDLENYPQFAESDMSYATRISQKIGAVAKPADGHLVFSKDMEGKSASGNNLPEKSIDASEVSNYSCTFKETGASGGTGAIFANWYDKQKGEYHLVQVGEGDPGSELNEIFASEKEARAAAGAKLKKVSTSNVTFHFSIEGRTDLFAEGRLKLNGFSPKIPEKWLISKVSHSLDNSGFRTSVECMRG
ncbi:MAG: hypothetical protein IJ730_04035 [Alphaproteobacteria bacterium]|nr:hypothetical protein [Alphaproteobacteria bacterium]